jgi:hypothetical protein
MSVHPAVPATDRSAVNQRQKPRQTMSPPTRSRADQSTPVARDERSMRIIEYVMALAAIAIALALAGR